MLVLVSPWQLQHHLRSRHCLQEGCRGFLKRSEHSQALRSSSQWSGRARCRSQHRQCSGLVPSGTRLSTMLSASLMQQQQHFWACQGQHNPHWRLCSDQWVLHTASATYCQHPDVPQGFSISLGCKKGRGCSVPVSHAVSQVMLGCRGVWRGGGQMTAITTRMPHAALPSLETPKLSFSCSWGCWKRPEPGGSCWGL